MNNFNNILIHLDTIYHELLEVDIRKVMFEHKLVHLFPQNKLSFNWFWLHVMENDGQDFTILKVVNMACRGGPSLYTFGMIKHIPSIFQITTKLHLLH